MIISNTSFLNNKFNAIKTETDERGRNMCFGIEMFFKANMM